MPAAAFSRFLALAKKGTARPTFQAPAGPDKLKAEQAYQNGYIERSLKYCRDVLGLGLLSLYGRTACAPPGFLRLSACRANLLWICHPTTSGASGTGSSTTSLTS